MHDCVFNVLQWRLQPRWGAWLAVQCLGCRAVPGLPDSEVSFPLQSAWGGGIRFFAFADSHKLGPGGLHVRAHT